MSNPRPDQEGSPLQSTRQMLDDLDALMERMLSLPVGDQEEELPPLPRDILRTPTVSASLTILDETNDLADEAPSSPKALRSTPSYFSDDFQEPDDSDLPPLDPFPEDSAAEQPIVPHLPPVQPPLITQAPPAEPPARTAPPPKPAPPQGYSTEDPIASKLAATRRRMNDEESDEETTEDELDTKLPPPFLIQRPVRVVKSRSEPRLSLGSLCVQPLVWIDGVFDGVTSLLGPIGTALSSRAGRALLGYVGLISLAIAFAWFVKEHLGWPW